LRRCPQAKALFVCCDDRAYLCRNCDFAVHSANAAAGAHTRWFLTTASVSLEAVPDAPQQPLGRAAAVKAAAAARAAAAAAAQQQAPARKAAPQFAPSGPQFAAPSAAQRHAVPRVPSFASLDVSLGMSDLLSFDKARSQRLVTAFCGHLLTRPNSLLLQEALLGGSNRDLAALGKLGSVGDLAAMFDGADTDRRFEAKAVPDAPPAVATKRDSGVETPPLGGAAPAAEDELATLGSALEAGRAAKRLRA
jgi:hypothetical protein